MDNSYDYLFKIVIIGDKRVGKSSLIKRFRENTYEEGSLSPTIGIDFHLKDVEINGKQTKLQLWDTAGEEHYKAVTSVYYRGASAAFIVFDLTRPETFENVKSWMEEVYMKCGSDVLITIIGNKSDMPTKIDTQIIDDFTDLHMCQWFTTSAKDGTNVDDIFMTVTNNLIELQNQMLSLQSSNGPGSLFLSMDEQNFHPTYCCSYF